MNGVRHYANMREPQILAVLARMVPGVVSLNYFMPYPLSKHAGAKIRFVRSPNFSQFPQAMREWNAY